jgi:hypothetical protein
MFNFKFTVDEVFPIKRKKMFTNVDVLSYIGGILGLISGFSFLSVAEIVYVFMMKPLMRFKCMRSNRIEPVSLLSERRLNFFKNYLNESSVHSFNYIVNEKRWLEK